MGACICLQPSVKPSAPSTLSLTCSSSNIAACAASAALQMYTYLLMSYICSSAVLTEEIYHVYSLLCESCGSMSA